MVWAGWVMVSVGLGLGGVELGRLGVVGFGWVGLDGGVRQAGRVVLGWLMSVRVLGWPRMGSIALIRLGVAALGWVTWGWVGLGGVGWFG